MQYLSAIWLIVVLLVFVSMAAAADTLFGNVVRIVDGDAVVVESGDTRYRGRLPLIHLQKINRGVNHQRGHYVVS